MLRVIKKNFVRNYVIKEIRWWDEQKKATLKQKSEWSLGKHLQFGNNIFWQREQENSKTFGGLNLNFSKNSKMSSVAAAELAKREEGKR